MNSPKLRRHGAQWGTRWFATALLLSVAGCFESETTITAYVAYNHTAKSIVSIVLNGEGGLLGADAYGGGGEMCCVVLPRRWRPGLKVAIKWQEDGSWLLDERGKEVIRDGKRVYVPEPYKEKVVEIPEYETGERMGQLRIHFFPKDEVKVTVKPYGPSHANYPYPRPRDSMEK